RRADVRRGPGGAASLLGPDRRDGRGGHDDPRVHALHGGGGVLPPPRAHEPGATDRAGHARRAAPGRGRADSPGAHGPRGGRRRGARGRAGDPGRGHVRAEPARHRRGRRRGSAGRAPRARGGRPDRPGRAPGRPVARGRLRLAGARRGRRRARVASMDLHRLWAVARKEWIQLRRDPRSMTLAFVLPLLLLLFFGYAITWDVDDIPIAVVDHDRTAASRALVEAFVWNGTFRVAGRPASERDATRALVL